MVWSLIIDFPQIFVAVIIIPSVWFVGIIHHCIVLYYLLVLRLLRVKLAPSTLKILPIIPSSTSHKNSPIILILLSYHYHNYYSFPLMFQVCNDI